MGLLPWRDLGALPSLCDTQTGLFVQFFIALVCSLHAGEDVSIVGFGVFGQACGPSVTSGILSAVITVGDEPVMLQATCAVHGGSSGGALFSTHSGKLLGTAPFSLFLALP